MKYIIASQHYKQWNNNHYECIAKFIKRNPDNTFSEVSPNEMLKDITACSFNSDETDRINIPNSSNWVFYPASDVNKNNIDEVLDDIVWPEAN